MSSSSKGDLTRNRTAAFACSAFLFSIFVPASATRSCHAAPLGPTMPQPRSTISPGPPRAVGVFFWRAVPAQDALLDLLPPAGREPGVEQLHLDALRAQGVPQFPVHRLGLADGVADDRSAPATFQGPTEVGGQAGW